MGSALFAYRGSVNPSLALLPSALVGPAVWRPVADLLGASGWQVLDLTWSTAAPLTPDAQLAGYLDDLPVDRPLVVVPHSNAGLFVPAITAMRQVEAMVFVDAGVPPRSGAYDLAPGEFYRFPRATGRRRGTAPGLDVVVGGGGGGTLPRPRVP